LKGREEGRPFGPRELHGEAWERRGSGKGGRSLKIRLSSSRSKHKAYGGRGSNQKYEEKIEKKDPEEGVRG